ncbi:MAG: nucleotidyltransferase family protein [Theionarchaea archaeon]|nr:nucleotidyltransferase family protein [Theionarchaea archaeon]
MKTAIVLMGGKGERLRPITDKIPKPLVEVCDKPILFWVLKWLALNKIENLIAGVSYKKEKLERYLNEECLHEMNICISEHLVSDGTATATRKAIENCDVLDEDFLLVYCDTITNIPLNDLYLFHLREKKIMNMVILPLRCNFGIVKVKNRRVSSFIEKPVISSVLTNAGIYVFNKKIIQFLTDGNLENSVFPNLATKGMIAAYKYNGFWRTINTQKDKLIFESEFENKDLEDLLT